MTSQLSRKSGSKKAASAGSESDAHQTLGQRLRMFRMKHEWSQDQLGHMLDISQQEVSQLENMGNIAAEHLVLLQSYGLDIDGFFDLESNDFEEGKDAVSRSLDLFKNLHTAGVVEAHPTRSAGLKSLIHYIMKEHVGIDVVGSSLKGLFINREILDAIRVQLRMSSNLKLRALISHPAFAFVRAFVEGRKADAIQQEIEESRTYYLDNLSKVAPNRVETRVALQPQTIFAIFLVGQGRAIINPYTLTIEAYSTHCLIIRDTGDPACMYRQFHLHHFENAFYSEERLGWSVSIDLQTYDRTADDLIRATKALRQELKQFESVPRTNGK